jgi:membrane protein YdbS with pleckstrin-like domain
MTAAEPIWDEEKLKRRYLKASKLLFLFVILYSLWIALVIMGVYFLELGIKWAVFTIEQWILSAIVLVSVVIVLEIIFFLHNALRRKKLVQAEQPQQSVYLHGKQVNSYTIPPGARGGIFSKTFIMIDETRVLNLRYQMIPPNELWKQKQ